MNALFAFLIAGAIGEVAFETYAFVFSPALFGGLELQPAFLVQGLAAQHLGLTLTYNQAFALHFAAGAIVFPLGYLIFRRVSPVPTALANGLIFGVALWAFAQGILAPLVGREPFMGFGDYTWSSLIAHPLFMMVFACLYERMRQP